MIGARRAFVVQGLIAFLALAAPGLATAAPPGTPPQGAPGSLVDGFGDAQAPLARGIALGPRNSRFRAVATQSGGKILAAGQLGEGTSSRLLVARYNENGSLDPGFGNNGIARGPALGSDEAGASGSYASAIAVSGNRILVGGGLVGSNGNGAGILVVSLNAADGSPDLSFGGDGMASALTGSDRRAAGNGLAVDSAGRITVAGTARAPGKLEPRATVARWQPGGTLDPGFGVDGVQQLTDTGRSSELTAVAAAPDGRVVVAGNITDDYGASLAMMFRLSLDGVVDPAFSGGQYGGGGVWLTNFASNAAFSRLNAVTLAPSGQIVAGGTGGNRSSADSVVLRLGTDGGFDPTFGESGIVRTPAASQNTQVARQPPPGIAGVLATPSMVYAGGSVEADGVFRLLSLSALGPAGAPLRDFGADVGPEYKGGLSFTAAFGTTYTFADGGGGPYLGPMGQTAAIAATPDGSAIVATGVIAHSLGQGEPSSDQQGFVALYRAAPEPPPAPPAPEPPAPTQGQTQSDPTAAAPSTPAAVVAGAPPAIASTTQPPRMATKLEILRAGVLRSTRRLTVLAPITARASGQVAVTFRAAGRSERFEAPINADKRRVRIDRRIARSQARLKTGILTIAYPGDPDTQPQTVRLRAASRRAALDAGRPSISAGGRLTATGTISRRARGVVRLQLLYEGSDEQTRTLRYRATIHDGRYRFDEQFPADVRAAIEARRGTVHSYTLFTGYFPRRIRGEMASFQVLGPR